MEYKTLKLKNGEVLACSMDIPLTQQAVEKQQFISVNRPVLFSSFKCMDPEGRIVETISMAPFLSTADNSSFTISTDCIMSWGDLRDTARTRYIQYLEHLDNPDQDPLDYMDDLMQDDEDGLEYDVPVQRKLH